MSVSPTIESFEVFLKKSGLSCMDDFIKNFKCSPEEIIPLINKAMEKGLIKRVVESDCCNSGCEECHGSIYEYYEWIAP